VAPRRTVSELHRRGRLELAPPAAGGAPAPSALSAPGTHVLDADGTPVLLHVPAGLPAGTPVPLLVVLHGAGGRATTMVASAARAAERTGTLLLAPQSTAATWDVIRDGFGPDVAVLETALALAAQHHPLDPARLGVGGFSDGASYALSLGLGNGDVLRHVLAWSPGFAAPEEQHGRPRVFVCHGTADEVLPIDRCSRPLVARLRRAGYAVAYTEFEGPHVMREDLVEESLRWFVTG